MASKGSGRGIGSIRPMWNGRLTSRMTFTTASEMDGGTMSATTMLKRFIGPSQSAGLRSGGAMPDVTIRYARPDDADALADLAAMDSSRMPTGVVLVAEVGGTLWAAQSVDDRHA